MPLTSSGTIDFNAIRTEYGINGEVSLGMLYSYSGVSESGLISLGEFRGKFIEYIEYPPQQIASGQSWVKDLVDTVVGLSGTVYAKYKTQVNDSSHGNGQYVAWANNIYSYLNTAAYNSDEWPPSGAFDKRVAESSLKTGWHTTGITMSSTADISTPPILYIQLPLGITLKQYSIQMRSACCTDQPPSKWTIEGSNDGIKWTSLNSQSGQTSWSLSQTKTFQVTNSQRFRYYRLIVYRSSGSASMHVGEFKLYGVERPLFFPLVSGLTLFLDAYNHSSGSVWKDFSGNNYDFTINASAFTTNASGIKYMNFSGSYGSAKRVVGTSLTDVPAYGNATLIAFTSILQSTTTWRTFIRGASGDHQVIINFQTGVANIIGMYDNDTAGAFVTSNFDITTMPSPYTQFNMMVWKFSTSSPYYQFTYNRLAIPFVTITNASSTYNNGFSVIGAYHDGSTNVATSSQYWGNVSLVLYYNRHLSDAEIIDVYDRYKTRYGLP